MRAVVWQGGSLRLLDQTRLPQSEVYLDCRDVESVFGAIKRLSVRGAPAIGIAAAYGLILDIDLNDAGAFMATLRRRASYLTSARPTAVNLAWSLKRMLACAERNQATPIGDLYALLEKEAIAIDDEDRNACRAIAEAGVDIVSTHTRLLTHCNAGSLAVSEYGTALAPIYLAHERGIPVHVFVDETRPLLQGSRLTAFELQRAGIPMTLIADSMAAHVMSIGKVDAVIVGADRVAANGDVANKIGTLGLAVLANHFGIPFYVACPVSTIDLETPVGSAIPIEERSPDELTRLGETILAPRSTPAFNPAFDVTPAALVTAIITERGVTKPPFDVNLAACR